jgi:hypothetical protein
MEQGDPAPAPHLQDSLAGWNAEHAHYQPHFQVTMQGVPPLKCQGLWVISGYEIPGAKACSKVHPDGHGSSWIKGSDQT